MNTIENTIDPYKVAEVLAKTTQKGKLTREQEQMLQVRNMFGSMTRL